MYSTDPAIQHHIDQLQGREFDVQDPDGNWIAMEVEDLSEFVENDLDLRFELIMLRAVRVGETDEFYGMSIKRLS